MKQLEVTIMGQSYILGCPEGGEQPLMQAVGSVDREMSAIRNAGKVKARERIAVLAALNLAYALAERPAERTPDKTSEKSSATSVTPSSEPSNIDLDGLILRIDQALGSQGQLL